MSKSAHSSEHRLHRVGKADYEEDVVSADDYIKCIYCTDGSCGLCEHGMLYLEDGKVPCVECGGAGVIYGLEIKFCTECYDGMVNPFDR